jgi:hypothetical protein
VKDFEYDKKRFENCCNRETEPLRSINLIYRVLTPIQARGEGGGHMARPGGKRRKFYDGDYFYGVVAWLPLVLIALTLAACTSADESAGQSPTAPLMIGDWIPSGPKTAPYLMGDTDKIAHNLPCNVAARIIYRWLDGKDRHYLVGWLPDGRAHVVVLSGGFIYDPLFHKKPVPIAEYKFNAISISEDDGWHLASLGTEYGNANLANLITRAGKQ